MMKFDPFAWDEALSGDVQGRLVVNLSAPGALFVIVQGFESLVGYGAAFDVTIDQVFSWRVEAPKGVRGFVQVQPDASFRSVGEIFSNPDRLVQESGAMLEVRKALRLQQIEHRQLMVELRRESAKQKAAFRAAAAPPPPLPVTEGDDNEGVE